MAYCLKRVNAGPLNWPPSMARMRRHPVSLRLVLRELGGALTLGARRLLPVSQGSVPLDIQYHK